MIVGFTGTQNGMTPLQAEQFASLILRLAPGAFHHGDCVGADANAHALVRQWLPACRIVIHPPADSSKRAFCVGDECRRELPYLERNKFIVASSDELIGAPKIRVEELRSGTWYTIRYARRVGKPVHMLWPW